MHARVRDATASSTQWQTFLGTKHNPYSPRVLVSPSQGWLWNSGRHVPVTLTLNFDTDVKELALCPSMSPDGQVSLVAVTLETNARIAHSQVWRDKEWVYITLPVPSKHVRLEFVESPSWVALHTVTANSI